ncbi:alpha/beta fold hydrolase [Demequina soli]|uniref:alpha/beta fold hydrolase n=1 Tax=Demequina soli TaxID=1638987 RepID=UPI000783C084|nr:alpha/beta fold hydrolase [Demequina soli]
MTAPSIALAPAAGPADAPTLVLGPSLGTSTLLWEAALPALATRFRVLAWDLPGHGAGPVARAPFTVGDLADTVADAVAGPFLYAGVSLGGAVGLELLLRHPDRVTAAAIVASGARIGDEQGWRDRAAQVRAQSTSTLIVPSAQRWFAPATMAARPHLTGRMLHVLQDADDESYALCCDALAAFDVRDRLGSIEAPVLAAWGELDAVTPEASARLIAEGVARGTAAGIAGASHLPPVDAPAATATLLADFLERTTP